MLRKIIKIEEDKCSGCGLCVHACHEGAIALINGKAKLIRDDYCDGLGDCLPACPENAIHFELREAAAYDEAAVKANMEAKKAPTSSQRCPGSQPQTIRRFNPMPAMNRMNSQPSQLRQWPVQLHLVPVNAPYFHQADLLIAADCTAYAYGNFHADFMNGRITVIGCPKLDSDDYAQKLTEILTLNEIRSVTIVRMEVPCCGGLEHAAITALKNCGKMIPWQVHVISNDGQCLN